MKIDGFKTQSIKAYYTKDLHNTLIRLSFYCREVYNHFCNSVKNPSDLQNNKIFNHLKSNSLQHIRKFEQSSLVSSYVYSNIFRDIRGNAVTAKQLKQQEPGYIFAMRYSRKAFTLIDKYTISLHTGKNQSNITVNLQHPVPECKITDLVVYQNKNTNEIFLNFHIPYSIEISENIEKIFVDCGRIDLITTDKGYKETAPEIIPYLDRSNKKIKHLKTLLKTKNNHKYLSNSKKRDLAIRIDKLERKVKRYLKRKYEEKIHSFLQHNPEGQIFVGNKNMVMPSKDLFLRTFKTLAEREGRTVYFVDEYKTSQICSCCGAEQKQKLNERVYKCSNCGMEEDRNVNSARNLKNRMLCAATCGNTVKEEIPRSKEKSETYPCGDARTGVIETIAPSVEKTLPLTPEQEELYQKHYTPHIISEEIIVKPRKKRKPYKTRKARKKASPYKNFIGYGRMFKYSEDLTTLHLVPITEEILL